MRVWDFLIEDYKTTAVKFVASGIDKAQVDVYINKFRELSNKQKLAGDEKNIDTWAKKTFSEFKEFVDVKEFLFLFFHKPTQKCLPTTRICSMRACPRGR